MERGREFCRLLLRLGQQHRQHVRWQHSENIKDKAIGIVGMGLVGGTVARNLMREGYIISAVHDKFPGKVANVPWTKVVKTPREVAEVSDVIISAVPKPPDVLDIFRGKDGLSSGLRAGSIWIDHTTTDYEQNLEFASVLDEVGAHVLEVPITGGLEALEKGRMTAYVAGNRDIFEQVEPILDASYHIVLYTGGHGTALIPKVISNTLCFAHTIAMGEALMIAKRSGIDLKTFWHSIRASVGNSFLWETGGPFIFKGDYCTSFDMDLGCKDIRLCMDYAKASKTPVRMLEHTQQVYEEALSKYGPEKGCYITPKLLEDELGESLSLPGFENWDYTVESADGGLVVRHKGIDFDIKPTENVKPKKEG